MTFFYKEETKRKEYSVKNHRNTGEEQEKEKEEKTREEKTTIKVKVGERKRN